MSTNWYWQGWGQIHLLLVNIQLKLVGIEKVHGCTKESPTVIRLSCAVVSAGRFHSEVDSWLIW